MRNSCANGSHVIESCPKGDGMLSLSKVSLLFTGIKIPAGNPVYKDEVPGQSTSARQASELASEASFNAPIFKPEEPAVAEHIKIDKSNILVIGPTGVGKTYILE